MKKSLIILLLLVYSSISTNAQKKSSYSRATEIITEFKKSGLKNGQEFTDKEGNTLRFIDTETSCGTEIKIEKGWHRHGTFFILNKGKIEQTTTYVNGKKSGMNFQFYPNGELKLEVNYLNNLKDGVEYEYRSDGSKYYVTDYVGGQKHGKRIEYRKNGEKLFETSYKEGKQHGERLMFTEEGILKEKANFIDGKKIGETEYIKH